MDPSLDQLAAELETALRSVLDFDEFDLTRGADGELECSTDEWTLHVEGWPDGIAWLAIDDEPDDPARYGAARRAVMSEAVERALAVADRAVDGALSRALAAGGDPFSLDFASVLNSGQINADES